MDIKVGERVSAVIENVPIKYRNYSADYKISTNDTVYTNVTVYGTQNNIDKITEADLNVYIDFAGYGAGVHDIPIVVEQNPSSLVSFAAEKVTIQITLTELNSDDHAGDNIGG